MLYKVTFEMSNYQLINFHLGEQYRTISCYWGNKKCNGFTNQKDNEHVCVDIDIGDRFCNDQFSGSWSKPPSFVNFRGGVGQGEIM